MLEHEVKDNINLGLIAKYFDGGGHPKASGFKFDKNLLDNVVYEILNQ